MIRDVLLAAFLMTLAVIGGPTRARGNFDAGNMTAVSRGLTDEQIDQLGHYVTGLR